MFVDVTEYATMYRKTALLDALLNGVSAMLTLLPLAALIALLVGAFLG